MILTVREPFYGPNDRRIEAAILLAMVHPSLPSTDLSVGDPHVDVVWDGQALDDALNAYHGCWAKDRGDRDLPSLADMFHSLYPDFDEVYYKSRDLDYNAGASPEFLTLISVTGTLDAHTRLFMRWTEAVRIAPSGDDSSFDYWPSEFGAYAMYAKDLSSVFDNSFLAIARNTYELVKDAWTDRGNGSAKLYRDRLEMWENEVAVTKPS